MSGNQESIHGQRSLHECMTAGKIGVGVCPVDHPRGLLDLGRMVIKVAQAVERLAL